MNSNICGACVPLTHSSKAQDMYMSAVADVILEHVSCDLCGSKRYKTRYRKIDNWLWLNQFEYPVVECIDCGLVYVNPRPTQQSMRLFYPQGYYNGREVETNSNRYATESAFLPKLTAEKVLDIGCARGDFLCFLKGMYPNIAAYGVDYFSDGVTSGDIRFYKQELTECAFEAGKFDIVTAWAVFEHLHKPSEYFREVSRILKDGGKFIFLVTNAESLLSRMALLEDVPRHTYHFSEKTLATYAGKYGFKFSRCIYDDRIFDGRGIGTFHFMLSRIVGITWEKRYFREVTKVQQRFANVGKFLDKLIFSTHWEAKLGRSGIMVAEFTK